MGQWTGASSIRAARQGENDGETSHEREPVASLKGGIVSSHNFYKQTKMQK